MKTMGTGIKEDLKHIGLNVLIHASRVMPRMFVHGFTVWLLWQWFIVPILEANPISYLEALGISIIVAFIRMGIKTRYDIKKKDYAEYGPIATIAGTFVYYVLMHLVIITLGILVKLLMILFA